MRVVFELGAVHPVGLIYFKLTTDVASAISALWPDDVKINSIEHGNNHTINEQVESRITHNPLQCGGKPCIRGMRIRVSDILQMLAEGVSSEEILRDYPDLELTDIQACLLYAARRANLERLVA